MKHIPYRAHAVLIACLLFSACGNSSSSSTSSSDSSSDSTSSDTDDAVSLNLSTLSGVTFDLKTTTTPSEDNQVSFPELYFIMSSAADTSTSTPETGTCLLNYDYWATTSSTADSGLTINATYSYDPTTLLLTLSNISVDVSTGTLSITDAIYLVSYSSSSEAVLTLSSVSSATVDTTTTCNLTTPLEMSITASSD